MDTSVSLPAMAKLSSLALPPRGAPPLGAALLPLYWLHNWLAPWGDRFISKSVVKKLQGNDLTFGFNVRFVGRRHILHELQTSFDKQMTRFPAHPFYRR
jgi:hypothetical protein